MYYNVVMVLSRDVATSKIDSMVHKEGNDVVGSFGKVQDNGAIDDSTYENMTYIAQKSGA